MYRCLISSLLCRGTRSDGVCVCHKESKIPLISQCKLSQHRKEIVATAEDARTCNALKDPKDLTRRSWENNPSVTHTCTNSEETRDFRILRRYAEIVQGEISGADIFLLDPRPL